jgi:hypothetical protein
MKHITFALIFFICTLTVKAQYSDIDFVKHYNKVGKDIFGFKTGVYNPTINTYYPVQRSLEDYAVLNINLLIDKINSY